MKTPSVLFGENYSTKVAKLGNYETLCIADTKRQFAKTIDQMKCINFGIKTVDIVAKVSYLNMDLQFHYNAITNEIIIVDIL